MTDLKAYYFCRKSLKSSAHTLTMKWCAARDLRPPFQLRQHLMFKDEVIPEIAGQHSLDRYVETMLLFNPEAIDKLVYSLERRSSVVKAASTELYPLESDVRTFWQGQAGDGACVAVHQAAVEFDRQSAMYSRAHDIIDDALHVSLEICRNAGEQAQRIAHLPMPVGTGFLDQLGMIAQVVHDAFSSDSEAVERKRLHYADMDAYITQFNNMLSEYVAMLEHAEQQLTDLWDDVDGLIVSEDPYVTPFTAKKWKEWTVCRVGPIRDRAKPLDSNCRQSCPTGDNDQVSGKDVGDKKTDCVPTQNNPATCHDKPPVEEVRPEQHGNGYTEGGVGPNPTMPATAYVYGSDGGGAGPVGGAGIGVSTGIGASAGLVGGSAYDGVASQERVSPSGNKPPTWFTDTMDKYCARQEQLLAENRMGMGVMPGAQGQWVGPSSMPVGPTTAGLGFLPQGGPLGGGMASATPGLGGFFAGSGGGYAAGFGGEVGASAGMEASGQGHTMSDATLGDNVNPADSTSGNKPGWSISLEGELSVDGGKVEVSGGLTVNDNADTDSHSTETPTEKADNADNVDNTDEAEQADESAQSAQSAEAAEDSDNDASSAEDAGDEETAVTSDNQDGDSPEEEAAPDTAVVEDDAAADSGERSVTGEGDGNVCLSPQETPLAEDEPIVQDRASDFTMASGRGW